MPTAILLPKLISNQATFDKYEIPGKVLMLFRESLNFGKSNTVSSERRNPILANVMSQLDNMEKRGTGLTRICNETKALDGYKDDLKPVFKSTPTQFQTIIYATADTLNVGDHDGDMSETKLTERQQKILSLIKESPTITGKQMSETLSVSQRTIERDLSTLQKKGVLKREGKDNDGMWIIKIK